MREKALEIAAEHIRRINPSMWDGNGEPPADFVNHRITYSVNRFTELDVSFEQDNHGWRHCCKLRDTLTNNIVAIQYGPGIDSPQQLANTILKICKKIGGTNLKLGDSVYTPRFCTVRITAIFAEEAEARRCGYIEPTYYKGAYIILGRSLDQYHMEFAAVPKQTDI